MGSTIRKRGLNALSADDFTFDSTDDEATVLRYLSKAEKFFSALASAHEKVARQTSPDEVMQVIMPRLIGSSDSCGPLPEFDSATQEELSALEREFFSALEAVLPLATDESHAKELLERAYERHSGRLSEKNAA